MSKRIAIAVVVLVGALWAQPALAATITVNSTLMNEAFDGKCTLLEAIENANHDNAAWNDCAGGSGADTINLASAATYSFTGALTGGGTVSAIATPVITTTITINGNGSTVNRVGGSGDFRYLYVAGGNLTLNDLNVTGASLPLTADGTIYNDNGTLTINRSALYNNGGSGGGAVTNRAAGTSTATLTIADSAIHDNTSSSPNASYGAGAGVNTLAVNTGTASTTITNTRIYANTATNQGAGVSNAAYNSGATSNTTITRSSITGNTTTGVSGNAGSSFGGGIANFVNVQGAVAHLTVTNSTVAGNTSQSNGYGGGLFNEADCGFGAPACGTTTATLENVTLYGNSAGTEPSNGLSRGGGIWSNNNGGGSVTTTLRNTMIAGNTNGDCRDVTNSFVRAGYNISTDSTCGVNVFTLGQLKLGAFDQSGQTWFYPLLAGSAAIDKVDTMVCTVTVDQIGNPRPFGSKCDVGAIESNQPGATPGRARSDFDGDGRSDAGIFRPSQMPNALWYAPQSGGGVFQIYFGTNGDIPVPADYDGDGKADAVIWRPSTGLWYGPRTGAASIVTQMTLGQNGDIPVPCDYNGDGAVDPAIWRPSTGLWYGVKRDGSAVVLNATFGQSGDIPVPADYDGDGKCDPGIYRPSVTPNALWYAVLSGGGVFQIYFGGNGDIPVPADYDGDGKADAAIFRPSSGLWYGPRTGAAQIVIQMNLGQNGDIPIPADYDGDGAADPGIYRPSTGLFYGVRISNSAVVLNTNLGQASGDQPTTRRPGYPGVYPY